ncbi:hypothetical protein PsorP6_005750 [Peronosclerospora sorghi]|uniref:Uncharacterized protein n=1 Tax=Peronosclerospora sorghi TaxID=230839 RepID=A0ACC0W5X9_9STRA|nr:hypothetical protein PsorP6_005750 [Peronosclerospora sorghi]
MMSLLSQPLSPRTNNTFTFGAYDDVSMPPASHTKDRPFACDQPGCGRRFNRKFTLSEHKKTHTGEKPYVCPLAECSRRFSTSGNLARHKRLHASLKPFECDINGCKRSFPSQEKLDHHIKIHTGHRTHMCRVPGCTKTFSTAGNLTRHIKNRHPELVQNSLLSYQYVQNSPMLRPVPSSQVLPITPATYLHDLSSHMSLLVAPLIKLEPLTLVSSLNSTELDELLTFQVACEPPINNRPRSLEPIVGSTVGDIARCSMSVIDEVIEFELTKRTSNY